MVKFAAMGMAAVLFQASPDQAERWTWTVYESRGDDSVTLAHEIPDSPDLKTTFECALDAERVTITLYDEATARSGFVEAVSGNRRGSVQAEVARGAGQMRFVVRLPLDHPVFAAFLDSGEISLRQGDRAWTISVTGRGAPQLSQFAQLCTP